MKEHNSFKAFETQLRTIAKENGTPLFAGFELTARCNFNCRMCYVHLADSAEVRNKELSTDEWLSIMDEACSAGMLFATLSGGECLLRDDFGEIYTFLAKRGVQITVKTNGFLIHKYIDLFKQYPPRKISITMYGSNEDIYEKVTGIRGFEIVKKAMEMIAEHKIPLTVSVTPSRFSYDDTPSLVSFLKQNHYRYVVTPFLIAPRNGIEREDYYLTYEEQMELAVQNHIAAGKAFYDVDLTNLPAAGGSKNEIENGIECSAGSYRFNITWNGYMVPCFCYDSPMLNIREISFSNAWELLKQNNKKVQQPVECNGCAYRSVCVFCPFLRYSDRYSGHCNKDLCKFTVEKVKRGILKI